MKPVQFTIFFILLCLVSLPGLTQREGKTTLPESYHSISSHELLEWVEELSSEKYRGRLSGSPEYLKAAQWCARKFHSWGIRPANGDSYFQYFPNEYTEVYSSGSLSYFPENGREIPYRFPQDYFPGSNSAPGNVTGELVYVGHGITAPELGYDDYEGVDVNGKIILLESGTPYTKNDSTLARWTPYAYHRYKFRNAVKHGAAGCLYIGKIANPNTVNLDDFVYAHIDQHVAEQIFADAGKDYSGVKEALKSMKAPSFHFPPEQKASISAETLYFPGSRACNVVGVIEGADPDLKDEVIIAGAHLDGQGHLGELFPGALDNASGVADVMGAAKALAHSEIKPKRTVLFILFGGEECGLYGSTWYAENPLFPVEKTVMMINLDMVGNGTGFFVSNGKSYPRLFNHFESVCNDYLHRSIGASAQRKNFGRPRSDASLFENTGIKTFSLWTRNSVHPVYYHHPLDQTVYLTPEIMEDAAKLLFLGILGVANEEGI